MKYQNTIENITPEMLNGFFVEWPNPPSADKHLKILQQSSHIVIAIDQSANRVVGFINAISDGVLSAYIPLLEVIPTYQNKGIGNELLLRMLKQLEDFYMIDLSCDDDLVGYYEKRNFIKANCMLKRNFKMQSGR